MVALGTKPETAALKAGIETVAPRTEPEMPTPEAKLEPSAPDTKPEPSAPQAELEPEAPQTFTPPSMSSDRPFSALEQVFIFTTSDGPSALKSEVTTEVLQEAAGETLANIRVKVPVDVIGGVNAAVLETIRGGSIPPSAWRALHGIKPDVAQQAQDGGYHLCVRTFPAESNGLVALFLLYNKQKF